MDLTDFKNEIISVPSENPVFIYIGVGTAAGMLNAQGILPQEHYHQFPPFLQNLRNEIKNVHLFLLLIDPQQEHPPYVAADYRCKRVANVRSVDHFKNQENNMQVFVWRKQVYTDPDVHHNDQAVNITEMLKELNFFAIKQNATLLYHDFTGRSVALLAEQFENDYDLVGHLDHIVYGLSAREDHGCLMNLTKSHAFFPFSLKKSDNNNPRPIIKLFNYYYYIANDRLSEIDEQISPMVNIQREQIINNIRTRFKEHNLGILRQLRKKSQQHKLAQALQAPAVQQAPAAQASAPAHPIDVSSELYIFNSLSRPYREMFSDLYRENEYDMISELFFHYCANQLNIMGKLLGLDISGDEMLTLITADEDPFKWYNNIKNFM
jgi:hypothetical protein